LREAGGSDAVAEALSQAGGSDAVAEALREDAGNVVGEALNDEGADQE